MPASLSDKEEVTALLHAWMAGENDALDRLMAPVQAALVNQVETVARDWRNAKLWLRREIGREAKS